MVLLILLRFNARTSDLLSFNDNDVRNLHIVNFADPFLCSKMYFCKCRLLFIQNFVSRNGILVFVFFGILGSNLNDVVNLCEKC